VDEVVDKGSLRASAGLGATWKSPFGPVRVDMAVPYKKEDFDRKQLFRISFGTRF
jgi:outer membrane protein insertion porin family